MHMINLFAGPGTGKSTMAAMIFAELKMDGLKAELVREFYKDLVWQDRNDHPIVVLAEQFKRQHVLDQVDYAVTDSPLLLNYMYNKVSVAHKVVVEQLWRTFTNHNFFITRSKAYATYGRTETYEEAKDMDGIIKTHLLEDKVPFTTIPYGEEGVRQVLTMVYAKAVVAKSKAYVTGDHTQDCLCVFCHAEMEEKAIEQELELSRWGDDGGNGC